MTPANKLFVQSVGQGPVIVLLHGGASSHRYWSTLAERLENRFSIVMPDLLGLGDSPKPKDSMYDAIAHTDALHQALQSTAEPFVLVGFSIGALVAIAYAKHFSGKVSRLILVSPPLYKNADEAKTHIVKAMLVPDMIIWGPFAALICNTLCRVKPLYLWLTRLITPRRVPDWMVEDSSKHTWTSYSRTMKNIVFNQTSLADLAQMTCPITIVWGAQDQSIVESNLRELEVRPNVRLVQFESGHDIPIFQAAKLAEIVQAKTAP